MQLHFNGKQGTPFFKIQACCVFFLETLGLPNLPSWIPYLSMVKGISPVSPWTKMCLESQKSPNVFQIEILLLVQNSGYIYNQLSLVMNIPLFTRGFIHPRWFSRRISNEPSTVGIVKICLRGAQFCQDFGSDDSGCFFFTCLDCLMSGCLGFLQKKSPCFFGG